MRRRKFITLLGGAAVVWPSAMRAQQKVRKVGILTAAPSRESFSGLNAAFVKGMRELGHIEGKDFIVEWRSVEEHYERYPELIAELKKRSADVPMTGAAGPSQDAKRGTRSTITIVLI